MKLHSDWFIVLDGACTIAAIVFVIAQNWELALGMWILSEIYRIRYEMTAKEEDELLASTRL